MPKGYARDDGMMGIYSDHTLVPWKSGRADSRLVENKTGRVFYEIDATAVNLNALTILGYVAVDGIIYASLLSKNWLGRSHFPFRREEGSMGCKESNGCRSSINFRFIRICVCASPRPPGCPLRTPTQNPAGSGSTQRMKLPQVACGVPGSALSVLGWL